MFESVVLYLCELFMKCCRCHIMFVLNTKVCYVLHVVQYLCKVLYVLNAVLYEIAHSSLEGGSEVRMCESVIKPV